ncbi:MAG TPA: alpha/beta fold hydrolase [Vicinamibacterales bacterium]
MTRHTVEINGRRLSWLQSGQGQAVILLHAFPLHAEMFAPQHEATPHGWTLITPDLRGFGSASGPPALSVDDHVDDLLALMRHLSIERAVIGGVSMGGYITLAFARRALSRCRALVLADTRAEPDTDEGRAARATMQMTARERGPGAIADAMLPRLLGPAARADSGLVQRVRSLALANRAEGIVDGLEALKTRPDSRPSLAAIDVPALVVVGTDDAVTPLDAAETLRQGIPGAVLRTIPGAGHLANLEAPQAFNQALWDFVQQLDRK